jgi:hypothetical protein
MTLEVFDKMPQRPLPLRNMKRLGRPVQEFGTGTSSSYSNDDVVDPYNLE